MCPMFDPDSFWEGGKGASTGGWGVPTGHTIQRFPQVEAAILMGQIMTGQSPSSSRGHGGWAVGRQMQPPSGSFWGPSSSGVSDGEHKSRGAREGGNQSSWTPFNQESCSSPGRLGVTHRGGPCLRFK